MIQKPAIRYFLKSLSGKKDRYLCALNGIFGDHLEKKKIRWATTTTLYTQSKKGFKPASPKDWKSKKKICILAHGSCSSERDWAFQNEKEDYGSLLHRDLHYTPLYIRYNSGLHISTNGKKVSDLLETLVTSSDSLEEIILVGHSMGGLVFRSACYYGEKENKKWIRYVRKIFYLGSPHLGTHLEKLGKLTTTILRKIPNPIVRMIASAGDLRSDGIKDLRHGYLLEEDWKHHKADHLFYLPQNQTPLLKNVDHYSICSTLSKKPHSKIGKFIGDGLVPLYSGMGQGIKSRIPFLKENCITIPGLSHYNLQRSPRVYNQIFNWCKKTTE